MIKAVVFDFDGTILDTETPWYDVFKSVCREFGVRLTLEEYSRIVGTSFDVFGYLVEIANRPVTREEIQAMSRERHAELMKAQSLLPGVLDYLKEAKQRGLKIGLASSSDRRWIEKHLAEHQIADYFDCVFTRDEVTHTKPDPELYQRALACLGVAPDEAIAFEDSIHGAHAGVRAGLYTVLVPNELTKQFAFEQYDRRLDSLADLPLGQLIEEVEACKSHN